MFSAKWICFRLPVGKRPDITSTVTVLIPNHIVLVSDFSLCKAIVIGKRYADVRAARSMPRTTKSSLTDHRFPAFYACYLLKSVRTPRATAYVAHRKVYISMLTRKQDIYWKHAQPAQAHPVYTLRYNHETCDADCPSKGNTMARYLRELGRRSTIDRGSCN